MLDKIGGFDETLNLEEDWDFILKIVNNFKVYSVPFSQSEYYTEVANNRIMQSFIKSNKDKIRKNNAQFYADYSNLNKKVNIIIPIYDCTDNINNWLDSIYSLNLGSKINIIISNNNPNINLSDLVLNNDIEVIETESNLGFSDSLNQGIRCCDNGDLLILSHNAILTKGSLESMQKYAYELDYCGLIVSQQLIKNTQLAKKHFPFFDENYWVNITHFEIDDNIVEMPLFYNGEILELKTAPFFCTYIKRNILTDRCEFDFKDEKTTMSMFSDYVRYKLGLKIFHVSDAKVFRKD